MDTLKLYVDLNGIDDESRGNISSPLKSLDYALGLARESSINDITIELSTGRYELTNVSALNTMPVDKLILVIGRGSDTEIYQPIGVNSNSNRRVTGKVFTLTFARCKYNINTGLSEPNLISPNWYWTFKNVLFESAPSNGYSVFYPKTYLRLYNCVKLTNTGNFLRETHGGIVEVYDSMGYFTSGYSTSQSMWDMGGNNIGTITDYETVLMEGEYPWINNKIMVLSDNGYYYYSSNMWVLLSDTLPEDDEWIELGVDSINNTALRSLKDQNMVGKIVVKSL